MDIVFGQFWHVTLRNLAIVYDCDGDLDLVSIGWYNSKLWVFENR